MKEGTPIGHEHLLILKQNGGLISEGRVTAGDLQQWMASQIPEVQAQAHAYLQDHPEVLAVLPQHETRRFIISFLDRSIQEDLQNDYRLSTYDAAEAIAWWLQRSINAPDGIALARELEQLLGRACRSGDAQLREMVLQAALEHVLGDPRIVAIFSHWKDDPDLSPLYQEGRDLAASWSRFLQKQRNGQLGATRDE